MSQENGCIINEDGSEECTFRTILGCYTLSYAIVSIWIIVTLWYNLSMEYSIEKRWENEERDFLLARNNWFKNTQPLMWISRATIPLPHSLSLSSVSFCFFLLSLPFIISIFSPSLSSSSEETFHRHDDPESGMNSNFDHHFHVFLFLSLAGKKMEERKRERGREKEKEISFLTPLFRISINHSDSTFFSCSFSSFVFILFKLLSLSLYRSSPSLFSVHLTFSSYFFLSLSDSLYYLIPYVGTQFVCLEYQFLKKSFSLSLTFHFFSSPHASPTLSIPPSLTHSISVYDSRASSLLSFKASEWNLLLQKEKFSWKLEGWTWTRKKCKERKRVKWERNMKRRKKMT